MPTKVCLVKAMVFPVVMCGCKSWTIKKGEHFRTDAFKLWCWRKNEAIDVLRLAKQVDSNAFMTMNTVMGVFGRGFDEVKGVK